MSDIDVRAYIDQLRRQLPYVPPVPVEKIRSLHRKGNYGAIVKLIRSTMNVDVGLTLHWTDGAPPKHIPNAAAWITLPTKMPFYGTPEFNQLKLDMFIRKSFAQTTSYDQFAITIAHELSHVVLDSIEHPLRREEKAVDLTAMILGFSYLYRRAAHTFKSIGYHKFRREWLGYLSERELATASRLLLPGSLRARHIALDLLSASKGLLAILGVCLAVWIATTVQSTWTAHEVVVAERAQLGGQFPRRISDYLTLLSARAGITSLTMIFQVTDRPRDLLRFENRVRANHCAAQYANIRKGVTYIDEYKTAGGPVFARVAVSSCP